MRYCYQVVYELLKVLTMMIQSANYVNARENMEYRRSYQPRNVSSSSEFALKNTR